MRVEQVLARRSRAGGLLAPRASPLVAMLSGGRDSTCLLDVAVALLGAGAVSALHVNYGLRAEADADERHCARAVRAARGGARASCARPQAPGDRGGRRATCRRGRARCATQAAGALARRARRADRHRAHRQRPGRDDPLPARRLARAPGAARDGAARGPADPPAARRHARADGRLLRERGLVARGREQRRRALRAHARAQRPLPALRAVHPAAEANVLRTAALLREETELLDGARRRRARGPRRASRSRACASCPRRSRGWSSCAWPRRPPAPTCPQAGERVAEILALGRPRRPRRAARRAAGRAR